MSAGAEARRALRSLGIRPETVEHLDAGDAGMLAGELERFVAYGYGQASQRRFLASPHPRLALRSPAEALEETGGASEVLAVIRSQLAALESGR